MNCSLCNMRSSTQYNRLCEKHYVKFLNKINNDLKYNETNQRVEICYHQLVKLVNCIQNILIVYQRT